MKELSLTESNIGDASYTLTYVTVPYYIFVNSNHQVYSNFYESNRKWTRTINLNTTTYRKDLFIALLLRSPKQNGCDFSTYSIKSHKFINSFLTNLRIMKRLVYDENTHSHCTVCHIRKKPF